MKYFTSDTHFGHENICGKNGFEEKRKRFKSAKEMDQYIIDQWNSVVKYNDDVYHLGDFSLYNKKDRIVVLLQQLNGRIHWIAGNHDSNKMSRRVCNALSDQKINGVSKVQFQPVGERLIINGYRLYLTHYGMLTGAREKVFSIHGHIHSTPTMFPNHINVGIDTVDEEFKNIPFGQPISEEQLIACIKNREQIMIDTGQYNNRDHNYGGNINGICR